MTTLLRKPSYDRVPPINAALHGSGLICYKDQNINYVVYSCDGLLVYNFQTEEGEISCEDPLFLYEKTKLTILSRVGELLDKRGLHRIHAFAVSSHNKALMCLLPMEAGKTTTTLNLLKLDSTIKIISDDVCLMDGHGMIYPFLLRIGARDKDLIENIPEELVTTVDRPYYGIKYFIEPAYLKDRISPSIRLTHIMIGQRAFRQETKIAPLSKIKCFLPIIESGVFGLGLPQLLEFFVRGDFKLLANRLGIILKRVAFCITLIGKTKTFSMTIGQDKKAVCDEILRFLNK
ncbi:MAG: hypothetical protein HQL21_03230 [Candidatus Omnitrophica bacterium]|nr:hypothetical protein [Candidatus Omnitrophota bacterium]